MVHIGKYDPNQHEPNQPFEVIPPGWYAAQISESEVRETKDKSGSYLWLELTLDEARHPGLKGRQLWARLNLWNANSKAVEIANRELAAICHAVGHLAEVTDTEVLHNKPMAIKVKVRPADGSYDASNEISGYDALAKRFQAGTPQSRETMTPPPNQAGGQGSAPAWANK